VLVAQEAVVVSTAEQRAERLSQRAKVPTVQRIPSVSEQATLLQALNLRRSELIKEFA